MKFFFAITALGILLNSNLHAAMIPYYDSVNELVEIVQNPDVATNLGTLLPIENIRHITKTNSFDSAYEISAKKHDNSSSPAKMLYCRLMVQVTYTSPDGGLTQNRNLSVGKSTCDVIN